LQLIRGTKIDHPKGNGGSKDIADAVAAVCHQLALRLAYDMAPVIKRSAPKNTSGSTAIAPVTTSSFNVRRDQALTAIKHRADRWRRS
jgi:hypothetical protein